MDDKTRSDLNDAIGLCESEASRWQGTTTGDHWRGVATRLRSSFFMDEILKEATERVRPVVERERRAEEASRIENGDLRFGAH